MRRAQPRCPVSPQKRRIFCLEQARIFWYPTVQICKITNFDADFRRTINGVGLGKEACFRGALRLDCAFVHIS